MRTPRPPHAAALAAAVLAASFLPTALAFTDKTSTTPVILQDGFGPLGNLLPNNGLEYCCPTAVAMSLSYLGVNGFNQIGPAAPTTADELNLDRILSGFMRTDALTGTASNDDITNAINFYLAAKGISASSYSLATYNLPSLDQLATLNTGNTVIDLVGGYYNTSNQRTGGHCVALVNQAVNIQGQSSPSTLVINNPLPGAWTPLHDLPSNSLQYLNTSPTSGPVAFNGLFQLDTTQYPGFWGSTRLVVEAAFALTVDPSQQSVNNPAITPWNINASQPLNINGGNLTVLAPLTGSGGLSITQPGTIELQSPDSLSGLSTINSATLKSDIAAGSPFGTGSLQLQSATLQLSPAPGANPLAFNISNASNRQLTFDGPSTLRLNRNGHASLSVTIGGYTDGATPNLLRSSNGTLIIAPDDGTASLGSLVNISVAGAVNNLPTLTNGIVDPSIIAQDNDPAASADFLTYAAGRFAPAPYTSSTATPISAAGSAAVYNVNSNLSIPAGAAASVYALRVGPFTLSGGPLSTLNVGPQTAAQAGILLNGGTIATSALNLGPAQALIYTSRANATIAANLQGSGSLTLFGPGTLSLTATNSFSGPINVNAGTLDIAAPLGTGIASTAITVNPNATLKISAPAATSAAASTTLAQGATLLLNNGTLNGSLSLNAGAFLQGSGTISGNASINGIIGGAAAPPNIHFTGNVSMNKTTLFDWRLNALDDNPADAGINWTLLTMTGPSIQLGTSASRMNFTADFAADLPDPNSGNIFWTLPHQWTSISSTSPSWGAWYNWDFPTFLQGYFRLPGSISSPVINMIYTPFAPASNTFSSSSGGSWALTSNWNSNLFAQHVGDTANFTTTFSAPATVALDNHWTLGTLNFHNAQPLTIAPGNAGSLTFNNAANPALINNTAGSLTFTAPLSLYSNLTAQTLSTSDSISFLAPLSGNGSLSIAGPGTTTLGAPNTFAGNTSLSAGTILISDPNALPHTTTLSIGTGAAPALVQLAPDIGASKIAALSIAPSAQLDITTNPFILEPAPADKSSTLSSLRTYLASQAITSSTLPPRLALALLDNALLNKPAFAGQPTDPNSLIIAPELLGDANVDNKVDLTDLSTILNHFGQQTPNWTDGNFDNAPTINLSDLSFVLNNFGLTTPTASQLPFTTYQLPAPATPTPEPLSLPLLLAAAPLLRRKRA